MNQPHPITAVLFGASANPDSLPAILSELGPDSAVLYLGPVGDSTAAALRGYRIGASATDIDQAIERAHAIGIEGALLLIALDGDWPTQALQRLLTAASQSSADVICPLGPEHDYAPLAEGSTLDPSTEALDTACFLLGDGQRHPRRRWAAHAALWRASAFAGRELTELLAGQGLRIECTTSLYVGRHGIPCHGANIPDDPRQRPPASPLSTLRERIAALAWPLPRALPGVEHKRVTLHILHGWGGGVEAFVRDFSVADTQHIHLALRGHGQFSRRRYGEALELCLVADGRLYPLRQWPLPIAIEDSVAHDDAAAAALDFIVRRHAVSRVIVSSLIGHSLDVLRTGLPTIYVCHDYYPLWPVLHADFGDATQPFNRGSLEQALRAADAASLPFAPHRADYWWQLRAALIDTLRRQNVALCAPTEGVRANWLRMAPELLSARFKVIAHGFRPFGSAVVAATPPRRERPRLLVLGRVNGGKALHLLEQALSQLSEHAELYLLGSGAAAHALFGRRGVHVVLDYERDDLPALIARIAPDAALLPATVAESFSYTLSELWALGVPPIATRIGSFAERIDDGVNGLLFDPDLASLIAVIGRIRADPALLAGIRTRLRDYAPRTLEAARADYAALLPDQAVAVAAPVVIEPTSAMQLSALANSTLLLAAKVDALVCKQSEQSRELAARTEWAQQATREVDRARVQLNTREAQFELLQIAFEDRARWAESLDVDLQRLGHELQAAYTNHARLEEEKRTADSGWSAELARVDALRTEGQQAMRELLNSTSWRATRPLRAITRTLRDGRARIGYWVDRMLGLPPRVIRSLRTRGWRGTIERIQQDTAAATTPLPVELTVALTTAGAGFAEFNVPCAPVPVASIIIPVYNKFPYTLACLQSIAQHGARIGFEVIVVDDCSSDETREGLARIDGITAIHNQQNLGFIGACNAGAAAAQGKYLVFLNNDTQVTENWLDALIDTFDQHRNVGLVGAKLVYPDGRLQEAGGIVFSDASGWNYGRFGDPRDPAYNYVREVDYCSGAAIAISRELFFQRGGFDTRYAPAYYEDTDLAFQVREAGLRVLYQPASTVIHFEGITSGTDVASGTKRYQVINQQKFAERWRDALPAQPRPGTAIALAREHRVAGRMLIVDATVPEPDKDSGSVRMVNLLRALLDLGWKVSFCTENRAYVAGYTEQLQQLGVETLFHPYASEPSTFLRETGTYWDAVMLSRHYVATPLLPLVRHHAPRARLIFDTVDLHYLREERAAALEGKAEMQRAAATTKLAELRLMRASDVTLVVSPVEQELLRTELPQARIEVLSNVHEVFGCRRSFAERRDIFFVGGFQHGPNIDAVIWFVAEIWPLVAAQLPDVRFHIVGSRMPESIRQLGGDRIIATGFVDSLDPYLDGCRMSVAPLRYGAGVKGKVNQSMAHGQPVVATALAAEGMFLQHDVDVLIADTPQAFADEIVQLYGDEALWLRLSAAGLANVERHFSFAAARAALSSVLRN